LFEEQEDETPEEDNLTNNGLKPVKSDTIENEIEKPNTVLRSDTAPENISNIHHDNQSDSSKNPAKPKRMKKTRTNKTPLANGESSEDDISFEEQDDETLEGDNLTNNGQKNNKTRNYRK